MPQNQHNIMITAETEW